MDNLSILGLYKWDNTIFDLLTIPQGLDKDVLVDNLLMELSELEILYPDADIMKIAIGRWSAKEFPIWEKLYKTTILEYNPIWNKDGKVTEIEGIQKKADGIRSDKEQNNGAATTLGETSGDSEHKVSAFNESDYSKANQDLNNATSKGNTVSVQSTDGESSYEDNDNTSRQYQRIEQGNIGVTTTQTMIKEEREIDLFNIYDAIIASFKNRFCLLIY